MPIRAFGKFRDAQVWETALLQPSTGMSVTYSYDGDARLVATKTFVWNGTIRPTSQRSTISYTPTGQRSVVTDAGGSAVT